jgi:hypothetical protein
MFGVCTLAHASACEPGGTGLSAPASMAPAQATAFAPSQPSMGLDSPNGPGPASVTLRCKWPARTGGTEVVSWPVMLFTNLRTTRTARSTAVAARMRGP